MLCPYSWSQHTAQCPQSIQIWRSPWESQHRDMLFTTTRPLIQYQNIIYVFLFAFYVSQVNANKIWKGKVSYASDILKVCLVYIYSEALDSWEIKFHVKAGTVHPICSWAGAKYTSVEPQCLEFSGLKVTPLYLICPVAMGDYIYFSLIG